MRQKRMLAVLACVGALAGVAASGAIAGEVNPPHGYIAGSDQAPLNGNSDCAYSGLNDNYVLGNLKTDANGNLLPDADGFTHNQNWGHVSKDARDFLTSINGNPGYACNPSDHSHQQP